MRLRSMMPLLMLFVLGACDFAKEDEGERQGAFEAQVSGAYEQQVDGTAAFAVVQTDAGRQFLLQMAQGELHDPFVLVALYRGSDARPAPGTYAIVTRPDLAASPDQFVADYTLSGEKLWRFEHFEASSGTLTISSSSARLIAGTVTFVAEDAGRTLTFTATFRAIPGH